MQKSCYRWSGLPQRSVSPFTLLTVSVCGGDPTEDYEDQEIELTIEELYDEMDFSDSKWKTPLGLEIHADLVRKELALRDELNLKYPLS